MEKRLFLDALRNANDIIATPSFRRRAKEVLGKAQAGHWGPSELFQALAPIWGSDVRGFKGWVDCRGPENPANRSHELWKAGMRLKGAISIQFEEG